VNIITNDLISKKNFNFTVCESAMKSDAITVEGSSKVRPAPSTHSIRFMKLESLTISIAYYQEQRNLLMHL